MAKTRSAPPELPGFTFEEGIGGGGFADVYLFTQHRPNRKVAVKVLRREHLSDAAIRQFEVEADLMAEVSAHPYIVTIFSVDVAPDGRPYIVMEYYPNPHFGIRARDGGLSVAETLRVGVQVASAVETAHRAGILHRDIKPANILTSGYGRPGLTDFGISGVRHSSGVDDAVGVSVPFAPPEVVTDDNPGSEQGDVYSLAATLYTLLAGRSPFFVAGADNGETALIDRVLRAPVPTIERADVPASLQHLLAAAMAKDPEARPASALALARQIQDIERELRLSPTQIDIQDTSASAFAPPSHHHGTDEADEDPDGTRISSLKVVRPDGPTASTPAPPAAPKVVAAPPGPISEPMVEEDDEDEDHTSLRQRSGPTDPPAAARTEPDVPKAPASPAGEAPAAGKLPADRRTKSVVSDSEEDHTRHVGARASAAKPDENDLTSTRLRPAAPPSTDDAETGSKKSRTPWIIAAAAALVLLVGGAIALTRGGGSGTSASAAPGNTAKSDTSPDGAILSAPPQAPTGVGAQVDGDKVWVYWDTANAQPGDTFRIESNQNQWTARTSPARLPNEGDACYSISRLNAGRSSARSEKACAQESSTPPGSGEIVVMSGTPMSTPSCGDQACRAVAYEIRGLSDQLFQANTVGVDCTVYGETAPFFSYESQAPWWAGKVNGDTNCVFGEAGKKITLSFTSTAGGETVSTSPFWWPPAVPDDGNIISG